jgi:hypothetical protein
MLRRVVRLPSGAPARAAEGSFALRRAAQVLYVSMDDGVKEVEVHLEFLLFGLFT